MKIQIGAVIVAMGFILAPLRSAAEDIDLFVGNSTANSDAPNVLIILDNTANWTTQFTAQKNALVAVLDSLVDPADPTNAKVNLGLMLYTESGGGNSNVAGGYVRAAIRPLNATYLAAFKKMLVGTSGIAGLSVNNDKSNSGKAGLAMAEAYLYFLGGSATTWERPWGGNNKNKTDYVGNVFASSSDSHAVWALSGNALNAKASTKYNSPVVSGSCADNFIIFIGNGPAQDSSSDNTKASNILKNMVGASTSLTTQDLDVIPSGSKTNKSDEWAYYMNNEAPVKVSTFALDVNVVNTLGQCTNTANGGWSALMESMSIVHGGGDYYNLCSTSFDASQFAFDLGQVFQRILARNSVFASVALPAAANKQSTFLNQVYIGMFRPDAGALPRWAGNLKQYQIGISSNDLRMIDADGAELIDTSATANGGFIKGCTRSFWTPASETSPYYWDYLNVDLNGNSSIDSFEIKTTENCLAEPGGSNTPDGYVVEKGAQAYTVRTSNPVSRTVWTCNSTLSTCSSNGLVAFSDVNIPVGALDEADATDRTKLISWAIGYDVDDENDNGSVVDMRPSIHGDIVHSQPVAIDYAGDPNNPDVVVFYGGNDGLLRAINGDQTGAQGSVSAGYEFWTFMPPEFYPHIKRLRVNTAAIQFPASGPTEGQGVAGTPKDYGMDGPLSAYEFDTDNDGDIDERTLFAGIRRAGRMLYSFDVTSKTTPALNWKIGCPNLDDDDDCTSTDLEALGQTWSRLSLTFAEGYDPDGANGPDPLLVTGGGYDNCEDNDNGSTSNNTCSVTKGNRIYVLDAGSGDVVKSFTTDRAVPGDVTLVTVSDADPRVMFIYAADTGGNVYRISGGTQSPYAPAVIGNTDPDDWIITKIASLGCDTLSSCNPSRKFLFGPDVVRIPDTDKFGILIGSGDREKPLLDYAATYGVDNNFYSIVDQPTNPSWLDDAAGPDAKCSGNSIICHSALTTVATGDDFDPDLAIAEKGWKLPMRAGEQVVTGAITVDNAANFSTHIPAVPTSCDAEYGEATAYSVSYENASGDSTQFIGGGLVPTPVAGKVIIDGVIVPFCIGCGSQGSPIGAGKVGGGITWTQPRSRVFWNIDQVDE